jgi:putative membrane protein
MRLTSRVLNPLPWLALIAAVACHRSPAGSSVAVPAGTPRMTEGNVVAVILAANATDLSYARLVPARARSAEVKAFATRMTTDHTSLNTRVNDIATRNRITAEDNAISLDFRDHSAARRDVLRELEGARFDSTYIANEIQYHQELLAALDGALLPNARTPELREFVANLKPPVSAHLAHAEQIRATLAARK